MQYIFIGIGGLFGASARYAISLLFIHNPIAFPVATMLVNLIGCFLLGFLTSSFDQLWKWDQTYKAAIKTGVIGSFTTFSTFSVEVIELLQTGYYLLAMSYILTSATLGIAFVVVGIKIGDRLVEGEFSQ